MIKILSIPIYFLLVISCYAQDPKKMEPPVESIDKEYNLELAPVESIDKELQVGDEFVKRSVVIYNNSNQAMSFLLMESTFRIDTVKIKGNDVWIGPVYNQNPTIKIQTQNHIVTYLLELGNEYMIFWNDQKKYWDVKKMKKQE